MLNAYFDEAGIHEAASITAIAGYVGKDRVWEEIEAKWLAVLEPYREKYGITWFHMTDCVRQEKQFRLLEKPHCNYLITQLSNILSHPGLRCLSVAVLQDDWDEVVPQHPAFEQRFPKPFDLCFDVIVRQLAKWSQKNADGETVVPMFAHSPEYSGRMEAAGRVYGAEPWYMTVLGPIAFGHPQQVIPLQGADMLVHQEVWATENHMYGPKGLKARGITLAHENMTKGGYGGSTLIFDKNGLELTAKRYQETGVACPVG